MDQIFHATEAGETAQPIGWEPQVNLDPGLCDYLRGSVWLSYVLRHMDWDWKDLKSHFEKNRCRSGLVYRWRDGKVSPSHSSAAKLADVVPGSLELFRHPLWELLKNKRMSAKKVRKLVAEYGWKKSPFVAYEFPDVLSYGDPTRDIVPLHPEDSNALMRRGDIHAFALILALTREAEANRRNDDHMLYIADLYRTIPALGKLPHFQPYLGMLNDMIFTLQYHVWYTVFMVGVDWPLIIDQIESDEFDTRRRRIDRHQMTPENRIHCDPVIHGNILAAKSIPYVKC